MPKSASKPTLTPYQPNPVKGYTACPIPFAEGKDWTSHREHSFDRRRYYHVVLGGRHGHAVLYANSDTYKAGMQVQDGQDGPDPQHYPMHVDMIDEWLSKRCRKQHADCRERNGLPESEERAERATTPLPAQPEQRAAAAHVRHPQQPHQRVERVKVVERGNVKTGHESLQQKLATQSTQTNIANGDDQHGEKEDGMSDVEDESSKVDEKVKSEAHGSQVGVRDLEGQWRDRHAWWMYCREGYCITRDSDRNIVDEEMKEGHDVFGFGTFFEAIEMMKSRCDLEDAAKVFIVAGNGLITSDLSVKPAFYGESPTHTRAGLGPVKTTLGKSNPRAPGFTPAAPPKKPACIFACKSKRPISFVTSLENL
ncbi:hypothetical protein C8R43DRAFT_965605 [Mycena crocata]|nr:hypothetical protein C8R43DRAFT_965605 [Mycena crocata]